MKNKIIRIVSFAFAVSLLLSACKKEIANNNTEEEIFAIKTSLIANVDDALITDGI